MHSEYALSVPALCVLGQPYPATRCVGWLENSPGWIARSRGGQRWQGWAAVAGGGCSNAAKVGRWNVWLSTANGADGQRDCEQGVDGVHWSGSAQRRAMRVRRPTWLLARLLRKEQRESWVATWRTERRLRGRRRASLAGGRMGRRR